MGKKKENDARVVAAYWAANGLPNHEGKPRPWAQFLSASELIQAAKEAPMTREDAGKILSALVDRGLIAFDERKKSKGPSSESFCAWLRTFWDFEKSTYIEERLAHGQHATRRHCQDMQSRVKDIEKAL